MHAGHVRLLYAAEKFQVLKTAAFLPSAAGLVGAAVFVDLLKDFVVPSPYKKFVPIPSAVSIPFFVGAPIAIDFCLGGAIMLIWCA